MPVPDFLCIGAQKAGTSWLDAMLRQHEEVFLPPMKEVHFFDFIYLPEHRRSIRFDYFKTLDRLRRRPGLGDYAERIAAIPRRRDAWYREVFELPAAAGRLKGEITPAYALLPPDGVARVRATNPGVRILLVVRDPVDRALSQLRMTASRRRWQAVDAARIAEIGEEGLAGVLGRSGYRASIERWEAAFPTGQLLYLPYGEMRAAPERFLRQAEDFLGLAPRAYAGLGEVVHATRPVEVAPEVVARLEGALAPERDWLARRFGDGFAR